MAIVPNIRRWKPTCLKPAAGYAFGKCFGGEKIFGGVGQISIGEYTLSPGNDFGSSTYYFVKLSLEGVRVMKGYLP